MKPASASGCDDGSTRSADSGAEPRGSNRHSRRSQSPSRSSQRAFSSIVVPGTSSTPPTMIRLGSPSAWASTQWMTLAVRIRGTLPGMSGRLEGKIAVVTGAGSGIGRATVRRFAAEGARVIAADLDLATAHETCAGLLNAQPVRADVTDRDAGRGDASKASTASTSTSTTPASRSGSSRSREITREEWDAVIDVNLTALFVAAQVAAPKLKGGVLLVTGSIIANRPRPGLAAYVASKNGVIGLARALAIELAPDIRVNVINPGPANTPMLEGFGFDTDPAQALPLQAPDRARGHRRRRRSTSPPTTRAAITGAVFNVDAGRDL